ncbi:tyrosine-type recombinase/integrase [Herbidospora daliensis]|uniref:tyrosine-type recombinase/integrase n=1 Tax=Herbidospora daliensis TaxID=295585 RepID=UPI0007813F77|nr:tyrosine-type recombinase/integrase [Herbidospora daliensis]
MTRRRQDRSPSLLALLDSYTLALDAANRSPGTIRSYEHTIRLLAAYLNAHQLPHAVGTIDAEAIRRFLLTARTGCDLDPCTCRLQPSKPGNVDKHRRNLRAYFSWLIAEGILTGANPMATVSRIEVPDDPEALFTDDELAALLNSCGGRAFTDRRDLAIMRVFIDTGLRIHSVAGIRFDPDDPDASDLDLRKKLISIRQKGGSRLWVPIGKKAAVSLDRYLRERAAHPHADSGWLWLGERGGMTTSGIHQMLRRRGERAGLKRVHAHRFRHGFADAWLDAGGNVQDLMRIAGWKSVEMAARYGRAAADRRAWAAHARLSPGDRI